MSVPWEAQDDQITEDMIREATAACERDHARMARLAGVLHDPVDPVGDERRRIIRLIEAELTPLGLTTVIADLVSNITEGIEA